MHEKLNKFHSLTVQTHHFLLRLINRLREFTPKLALNICNKVATVPAMDRNGAIATCQRFAVIAIKRDTLVGMRRTVNWLQVETFDFVFGGEDLTSMGTRAKSAH